MSYDSNPFEPPPSDPARRPWIILRCIRCGAEVGRVKYLAPATEPMTCLRCFAASEQEPRCPHGNPVSECNACYEAADFAYDAAREDAAFGRR